MNLLEALKHRPMLAYAFLAIRFFGLVMVIAVAEEIEMFLRAFLIRYVEDPGPDESRQKGCRLACFDQRSFRARETR